MPDNNEITVVDNIILEEQPNAESDGLILFSNIKSDAKPLVSYNINVGALDYPQWYQAKCTICNSPYRQLLEHVYIDCGKKINPIIKFFEKHYNARLNFAQVKTHINNHCDFTMIKTSGLKHYEDREEEINKWKYREYELALTVILVGLDELGGIDARTPEEKYKKIANIDRLTKQLVDIKQKRDAFNQGLPNIFDVLAELHEMMVSEEDKRIIRQKGRQLQKAIS